MLQLVGSVLFALVVSVHSVSRPPTVKTNPARDIYYKPGETLEVPCKAIGNPRPSYRWTRNKVDFNPSGNDKRIVQLPNSGTLVFSSPEEKDEGIYQCFAENDFGTSVSINCNLRVAKLQEFSIKNDEVHKAELGLPYTIPCVPPESVPRPEVIWIIQGEGGFGFEAVNYDARVSMDKEYRLRFAYVKSEDEQDNRPYACMAMNPTMRKNVQSHLHFIEVEGSESLQPVKSMFTDPFDLFALEGDTFSMQCIFSGNPIPQIQWERTDNKPLSKRAKLQSYAQILQIEKLELSDAGKYLCWATNAVSGSNRVMGNFNLRIGQRPYWIHKPEDIETSVDTNAEFTCMGGGDPTPGVKWFINGIPLDDKEKEGKRWQKPIATKLFFGNVQETDHMVIQCNISNKHGYVFADVFLNVLEEAPEMILPPQSLLISAEELDVNISCKTTGKPDPIITWKKDGAQVTGGRFKILPDGTLQIKRAVFADASRYRCEAANKFGSASGEGRLIIRRKTRIEQKPGDLERTAGMDAKFTCSGTTDPQEVGNLRIYWMKDGDEILANDQRSTTNYQDNSLTISGTIVRDSGTYTCVATNGLDKAMASAVLTVRDRPDPPIDVHQLDCNKNVTIKWLPGSFNNAPLQYYVLQYNTSFNPDQWSFAQKVNYSESLTSFPLSPWVHYNFRLIAYNKIGASSPSKHTPRVCISQPDRPSYHPKNLRTLGHQRNTLYIQWTPIPEIQHNDLGFFYYLSWYRVGDDSSNALIFRTITNWTVSHFEFKTGYIYTRYKITIKAGNNIGEAKEDPSSIIGYSFEDTPLIVPTDFRIEVEGDTFALFSWKFPTSEIGKVDTKIRGEFMGFRIQFWQMGDIENTLREYYVGPESAQNITGNLFTSEVRNMIPNTRMEALISVRNNYYIGQPSEIISFQTSRGVPGPVDYFRVANMGDTHVNLEWGSPLENRGDLTGYDISYQLVNGLELGEMQDREPQINDPHVVVSYLSGLQPRRKYRIYIFARTAQGRGEGYFIEIVTTKPVIPEIPDFTIPHIGSNFINVSWWVDVYKSSGSVIFVEYRKLDGAEWLRTSDEVFHTWQEISNLEPGTKYEVRIKATNGVVSIPSSIEEVETHDNAPAYDLAENYGWFIGVFLAMLLLIIIIILLVVVYKQGTRFTAGNLPGNIYNSSAAYSGTYDNNVHINDAPEPKGYNNDYYDEKDNYDYDDGGSINKPPSYSSENGKGHKPTVPDYEDYDGGYGARGDYEKRDYYDRRDDDYYGDNRDDGYDYDGNYDGYDYDNDKRDYDGYDYDRRNDDYDRRRDDGYGRRSGNLDQGYDYDSEDTGRRPSANTGPAPSSTFV